MSEYRKIKNRSDAYQPLLLEISCAHELLDIFTENDSIYKKLNPFHYNDEVAELEDQLKKELWRIIEENLTERQKEIVKMTAAGKTQVEIAKVLGVNQSSIVKSLNGNQSYVPKDMINGKPLTYGGVKLKLQKIVKEDMAVNAILAKIAELRDNEPFDF